LANRISYEAPHYAVVVKMNAGIIFLNFVVHTTLYIYIYLPTAPFLQRVYGFYGIIWKQLNAVHSFWCLFLSASAVAQLEIDYYILL
jgi:hypothetical protein